MFDLVGFDEDDFGAGSFVVDFGAGSFVVDFGAGSFFFGTYLGLSFIEN